MLYNSVYDNDNYAFYPDQYFLYRTAGGLSWEQIHEGTTWSMATNGSTLVGQFWMNNAFNLSAPVTLKMSFDDGIT